jgi:rhamnosyltransferase
VQKIAANNYKTMTNHHPDLFCAVIVSYNPTPHILKLARSLILQFSSVIVVDNGSNNDSISLLKMLESISGITVHYNENNLGIAIALNKGIEYALDLGCEWVGTFDQDSLPSSNYLETMIDSYEECRNNNLVAIISPRYLTKTGLVSFGSYSEKKTIEKYLVVKSTMTSGNLIKLDKIKDIGRFDEDFFIDYVDHEFCLRVRRNGFKIIESCNSLLQHELGSPETHSIAGINIITTNHSYIRRYYKYRNMVKMIFKHVLFEPEILYPMLKSILTEPLKIIFFEEGKLKKIHYIIKGITHGLCGGKGKML